MGIEQRIRNILLNDKTLTDAMKKISKKDNVGIHINTLPDGDLDEFPYILIQIVSLKDSLFYDDESYGWDVIVNLGIGVKTYKESIDLSNLVHKLLGKFNFTLVESDSFDDKENNFKGSRLTFRNNIFDKD